MWVYLDSRYSSTSSLNRENFFAPHLVSRVGFLLSTEGFSLLLYSFLVLSSLSSKRLVLHGEWYRTTTTSKQKRVCTGIKMEFTFRLRRTERQPRTLKVAKQKKTPLFRSDLRLTSPKGFRVSSSLDLGFSSFAHFTPTESQLLIGF